MTANSDRFTGDWLVLREPADHAARSERLACRLAAAVRERETLNVIDLGAGTGSNLRWLAPRLAVPQDWLLVDHDTTLLERAERMPRPAGSGVQPVQFRTRCADLKALPDDLFEGVDLVTASALFDLASRAWVEVLAWRLATSGAAALFALTVDGRRWFTDAAGRAIEDPRDARMRELFNRHQRRVKGLGAALGPQAASALPVALETVGLQVQTERADWRLAGGRPGTAALGEALLADWARAAGEHSHADRDLIESWHCQRLTALQEGRLGLAIGHVDVLALPRSRA